MVKGLILSKNAHNGARALARLEGVLKDVFYINTQKEMKIQNIFVY